MVRWPRFIESNPSVPFYIGIDEPKISCSPHRLMAIRRLGFILVLDLPFQVLQIQDVVLRLF
jgi:hypothetical protein